MMLNLSLGRLDRIKVDRGFLSMYIILQYI